MKWFIFAHFQTFPKIPKKSFHRDKSFLLLYTFTWYKNFHWRVIDNELPTKSKHGANGSLLYLKSFVCAFMWAVWFKILSKIDICMKVTQARQATFDTEVANIQKLLNDLAGLRNNRQAVWNKVTTVASNLIGIEIKLPPGGRSALRSRDASSQ